MSIRVTCLPVRQLVLSALLQLLPVVRVAATDGALASAPIIAILRALLGAAAVAGSLHAVSGASITVRQPPNSAVRATNGVESAFRLDVQYNDGEVTLTPALYVAQNLPPGFNPPAKSGPVWRITGTPTQTGVFNDVRVTAYKFTPINAPDQESTTIAIKITVVDGVPKITTQPADTTAAVGAIASFSVEATGGNLTYQWRKGDLQLTGKTGPTLTFNPVKLSDAGTYQVFIQNSGGGVLSDPAELVVTTPIEPPTLTIVPKNTDAHLGESVRLTSAADGPGPLSYLWSKGGQALLNQTSPDLFIPEVGPLDAGSYSVAVTGAGGTTTSPSAEVTVAPPLRINGVTLQEDTITILFNGIIGRQYILQATTDLRLPTWDTVGTMLGTEASSFSTTVGAPEIQTYRVQAP